MHVLVTVNLVHPLDDHHVFQTFCVIIKLILVAHEPITSTQQATHMSFIVIYLRLSCTTIMTTMHMVHSLVSLHLDYILKREIGTHERSGYIFYNNTNKKGREGRWWWW